VALSYKLTLTGPYILNLLPNFIYWDDHRFSALKRRSYSSGTLWATIVNLPRDKRFLFGNKFLLLAIPGPHEPNTEQLNGLVTPFIDQVKVLGKGIVCYVPSGALLTTIAGHDFSIHNQAEKKNVSVVVALMSADTPAQICAGGCASVTSEEHMCYMCDKTFSSLTDPSCFDPSSKIFV